MKKSNQNKPVKSYEVTLKEDGYEGTTKTIPGRTPAAARYQFFKEMDFECSYKDIYRLIKVKSLGQMKPTDFFTKDLLGFDRMKDFRGIEFATLGMNVIVSGKKGVIVGNNSSMNLDVLFDGDLHTCNCHPHYRVTYFHENGEIIKDYNK